MSTSFERQRWLEERRKGIGASEAAAVLGCSPWQTALEVWSRKTGQLAEKEPTEPMKWGLRLEDAIAMAYEEQTGVRLGPAPDIMQHPQHAFMLASLDRLTTDRAVELKAVGPWSMSSWGDPGTDDIPEHYILQVQQQMAVADVGMADVAALFSGQDFRIYSVARNEKLICLLADREAEFWEMILSKRPPEPDWAHRTTLPLIHALYGVDETQQIELAGERWLGLADQYDALGEEAKLVERERGRVQAELLHGMGTAALAMLDDGSKLTRKEIHRSAYEVRATSYVKFGHRRAKARVGV